MPGKELAKQVTKRQLRLPRITRRRAFDGLILIMVSITFLNSCHMRTQLKGISYDAAEASSRADEANSAIDDVKSALDDVKDKLGELP